MYKFLQLFLMVAFLFHANELIAQTKENNFNTEVEKVELQILNEDFHNSEANIITMLNSAKEDSQKSIVHSLYGRWYSKQNNFANALVHIRKSLDLSRQSSQESKAYAHLAMSTYYISVAQYDLSIKESFKALEFARFTSNNLLIGHCYYNLYSCYAMLRKPLKTDIYAQKMLQAYKKTDNDNYIALANSSKAIAVRYRHEILEEKAYKDSIRYYLAQSLCKKCTSEKIKAKGFLDMANYYMKQIVYDEELINSQKYHNAKDSLQIYLHYLKADRKNHSYASRAYGSALVIEGMVKMKEGEYQEAEKLMLEGQEVFNTDEVKNRRKLFNISMALKDLALKQNDYKKAFIYLQKQYDYNDLIFDKQQDANLNALEAKFQNEKIKNELEFAKKETQSKQIQVYLFVLLLLLLIIAVFFIVRNTNIKIIADRQNIKLLENEKREALDKVQLEKEKQARLLAERKLLELEKENIQKKALVNAINVKRKDEVLKQIQDHIGNEDAQLSEIKRTLKLENYTDQQIKSITNEFKDINPEFFGKLKKINPRLTPLDITYCVYIYVGLTNKDIASNLNVEQKSVRMSKYRLKKKLHLDKEQNLEHFLRNEVV